MLIFISLDALSTNDFKTVLESKRLKKYLNTASYVNEVSSVFVSNTYTAHSSIVTGVLPKRHGIIDNLVFDPGNPEPNWKWYEPDIKTPNLFRAAAKHKLKTAALLWPVSAKAPIKYNMPEILPRGKESQISKSLKSGSKLFQIEMFLKYKDILDGVKQPNLDNFVFTCMKDVIRNKKIDLLFAHFTEVDTAKHIYGPNSEEAKTALKRHIYRLEKIFTVLEDKNKLKDSTVFIFGDHSSLECTSKFCPNLVLRKLQLADFEDTNLKSYSAWFKVCGGTAFLKLYDKSKEEIIRKAISEIIEKGGPIKRFLSDKEMRTSGFSEDFTLGIEASDSCFFYELKEDSYRGQHGYTLKHDDYSTSIIAFGKGIKENAFIPKASILDICPTALEILDIPQWPTDGNILTDILN